MSSLSTFLEDLTSAPTIEALWEMHTEKMAQYGFDRLLYGFSRYLTTASAGDPQDMVILSNHDPSYVQRFVDEGLYFHAPMVTWARAHDGACSWSLVADMAASGTLTDSERRVLEYNQNVGITAGYTVSFKSVSARSKGAIALTARRGMSQAEADDVWAEHGADIVVINNVAHLKIISLPYMRSRNLTPRQREVLEWVGDGKTTQDIAEVMGLTAATVEKHLRLAREALDVDTTAQAVLKAAFQNQMFVLDA
ncbi:MAG: LuxR family transcriptional regulator [Pseudomonadota bacterium]